MKCQDLHKKFGKKEILKGVSLELYQGDILGFIGPNGAGKTTTIKLILGLQSITSGVVSINGYDIEKQFTKAIEKVGAIIENGANADIKVGNALPLMNIPVGTVVHCIEMKPGKGAQLCRSAGSSAQILGREDKYVLVRLQSGETRKILGTCIATIGVVGNEDYELVNLGKAGRTRHMGIRPTNRGSVMNPNDHPHGGGEGRTPVGRKSPMTPWGKPALGYKTRKNKKASDKLIVSRKKK